MLLHIVRNGITKMPVDTIVNAAIDRKLFSKISLLGA